MNRVYRSKEKGFTIIELSLAMAFIALLLLGIAMLTLQIGAIYNKGLTMRAVNDAGQLIARDIQQTLNSAVATDVIFKVDDGGGRLCANNIVYAWNYAGRLHSNGFNGNQNIFDAGSNPTGIRMVRFVGSTSYCTPAPDGGAYPLIPATSGTMTALLKEGDNTLALSGPIDGRGGVTLEENNVVGDSEQRIYQVSFILGTNDATPLTEVGCEVPESSVDDQYCAVNKFEFTARAGNQQPAEGYGG